MITPDLKAMTPAQKRRLSELMMNDIDFIMTDKPIFTPRIDKPRCDNAGSCPETIDKLLGDIEHAQKERAERHERESLRNVEEMFNREELFRFAYVPFVIAELVWDYADTVIIMAQRLNDPSARRLSRVIRRQRAEYDRMRHMFIDAKHREREIENGYVFEESTKRITAQMMLNVRLDINSEYPSLNDDSRNLLFAVYQCHITSRALLMYLDRQTAEVERRVGHVIGKMLPPSYYVMDRLIPEFIGDKPASERFRKLMKEYIKTFATQIALVGLNDIDENKQNQ